MKQENKHIMQASLIAKAVKSALHQNANSNIGINANNCRDILEASFVKKASKAVIQVLDEKNKGSRIDYDFQVACKEVFANHEAYSIDRVAIDRMSDMFKRINPASLNSEELLAEFFKQYVTATEVGGQFYIDAAKHDYDFDMFQIRVVKTTLSEKFKTNFADDRFEVKKMPNQYKGIGHNYKHFNCKYGEVNIEDGVIHVFGPQSEIKRSKIKQHLVSTAEHKEKAEQASLKQFEEEAIETVLAIASDMIEEGSTETPDAIVKKDLAVLKSASNMYSTAWSIVKAEEEAAFNAYKLTQGEEEEEDVIDNDDNIRKALSFGPEVNFGLSSMTRKASALKGRPIQYLGLLSLFSDNGYRKGGNVLNFDSEYPSQAMANLLPDEYMSGAAHLIGNSSKFYTMSIIAGRKGIDEEVLPDAIITDGTDNIIDKDGNVFDDARLSTITPVGLELNLIKKDNGRLAYAAGYHQIKELRSQHVSSKVVINLYLKGSGKRAYNDGKLVGFNFNEAAQENIECLNQAITDDAEFIVVATKTEMFLVAKRVVDGKDSYEFVADIDPSGKYKDYDKAVLYTSSKLKQYMNGMVIENVRTSVAIDENGQAKAVLFGDEIDERFTHTFKKSNFLFEDEALEEEIIEEEEDLEFSGEEDYSMFLDNIASGDIEEEEADGVVVIDYSEFTTSTNKEKPVMTEEEIIEEEEEFFEEEEVEL